MIPERMRDFLQDALPERTWRNRLIEVGPLRYMEFGQQDVERLASLGIAIDPLGPRLVACMWVEDSPIEIGGFLVVDNLAMGKPSMGGIRMLPQVTPAAIHNLARGMTLKNAAAKLPYGGGKSGIVADPRQPAEARAEVIRGFARLIKRYDSIYLPGPDVGTNDEDMRTVAVENGLNNALSKPADMGGNCIDELGAAAGGVVIAIEAALREMPRLKTLPQFQSLQVPGPDELTLLIQGFGAVGANAARLIAERMPGCRVLGISDAAGYLYAEPGLPVSELFELWCQHGMATRPYFERHSDAGGAVKFSSEPNDLLREWAFCLVPAAPIANYLDTDSATHPSMTTERMGRWSLIVEGANTYSPDPERRQARARMERAVYRQAGTLIATDYLVNSGGVIFAAQEHLIRTPPELRIPEEMLGDGQAVAGWLRQHQDAFGQLAEARCEAAIQYRDEVIQRNIQELVDQLLTDADMLPCEAAERISVTRIAVREHDRSARDIMAPIPTAPADETIQRAARQLLDSDSSLLAVLGEQGELVGVVTEWDFTRALAAGSKGESPLSDIMAVEVISASPSEGILELVRKLETHEISAMPVVEGGSVLGLVSADLLARRSLLGLLQSQLD